MSNSYEAQVEKYEIITGQHGGYFRHDFVDHAYLYNLYFPPEAIFTALKDRIHDLVLNYPVAQDALAGLVGAVINQPAERIVVGNGAAELIKIVSGHLSKRLIVPVPSFNEYANAAPSGTVLEFPLDFPSFELDVDTFAAEAIKARADIAVVVTPNNPTSLSTPRSDLIRLVKRLEPHGCMLIVDESFMPFAANPEQESLEHLIGQFPNLAVFKSMSKAYGICGLRIGYMVTGNASFAEAVRAQVHIWNINGFAEEFLRLLPDYQQEFTASCEQVRADRDSLYEKLNRIDGMTVFKPDANYVFCRLPEESQSAPDITRQLFIQHNMYIKDCSGKTQPDADRYLRIASRTESENVSLVAALIDVLKT